MITQALAEAGTQTLAVARGIGIGDYFSGWVPTLTTIFSVGIFAGGGIGAVTAFAKNKPIWGYVGLFAAAGAIVFLYNFGDFLDMIGQSHRDATQHHIQPGGTFHQRINK